MPSATPTEKTPTPIADGERRTPAPPLTFDRLVIDKDKHQIWCCDVDVGVTLEDLLTHTYWVHKPKRVRPKDEVKVYSDDGTWRAHLHVIAEDETGMTLDMISFTKFRRVEQMRKDEAAAEAHLRNSKAEYQRQRTAEAAAEAHLRNSTARI